MTSQADKTAEISMREQATSLTYPIVLSGQHSNPDFLRVDARQFATIIEATKVEVEVSGIHAEGLGRVCMPDEVFMLRRGSW
jgi:hypothetical protein